MFDILDACYGQTMLDARAKPTLGRYSVGVAISTSHLLKCKTNIEFATPTEYCPSVGFALASNIVCP